MKNIYRHGEIALVQIPKLPKGLTLSKKVKRKIKGYMIVNGGFPVTELTTNGRYSFGLASIDKKRAIAVARNLSIDLDDVYKAIPCEITYSSILSPLKDKK